MYMCIALQGPRAAALGASLLDPLAHVASRLRGVSAPNFGPEVRTLTLTRTLTPTRA